MSFKSFELSRPWNRKWFLIVRVLVILVIKLFTKSVFNGLVSHPFLLLVGCNSSRVIIARGSVS